VGLDHPGIVLVALIAGGIAWWLGRRNAKKKT
jgi:hypothetical protein